MKLTNCKPLIGIPQKHAHQVALEWTQEEQANLKLVEIYIPHGALAVWRVPRWWISSFSFELEDTEIQNDVTGQCYDEWPFDTRVDFPIIQ